MGEHLSLVFSVENPLNRETVVSNDTGASGVTKNESVMDAHGGLIK